jgi:hypothetical protein
VGGRDGRSYGFLERRADEAHFLIYVGVWGSTIVRALYKYPEIPRQSTESLVRICVLARPGLVALKRIYYNPHIYLVIHKYMYRTIEARIDACIQGVAINRADFNTEGRIRRSRGMGKCDMHSATPMRSNFL